jgi:hypothetical protein
VRYSAEIPSKFRTRESTPQRSSAVLLREAYAEADPRSLAVFRIALGLVVSRTALERWGIVSEHLAGCAHPPLAIGRRSALIDFVAEGEV